MLATGLSDLKIEITDADTKHIKGYFRGIEIPLRDWEGLKRYSATNITIEDNRKVSFRFDMRRVFSTNFQDKTGVIRRMAYKIINIRLPRLHQRPLADPRNDKTGSVIAI